jgi:hypothetical protein
MLYKIYSKMSIQKCITILFMSIENNNNKIFRINWNIVNNLNNLILAEEDISIIKSIFYHGYWTCN